MNNYSNRTGHFRRDFEQLEGRIVPSQFVPDGYVEGRLLVTLSADARSAELPRGILRSPLVTNFERLADGVYQVDLTEGVTVKAAAAVFARLDGVRAAEPDYVISLSQNPNDPRYLDGSLWGLHNTGQAGVADADIDGPEGWAVARGTGQTVVAVIDTGVEYTHPDLAANMWRNPGEIAGDGIDNDSNGFIDDVFGADFLNRDGNPADDHGHGTHVAGTIGAVGNNGIGVTGVAWTTRIMALKFLGADGRGSTSDAVRAIDYAVANGAKVLNNSWGGGGASTALQSAIQRAGQAGVVFVAAAGNSGSNNDTATFYPAGYISTEQNVVVVAATSGSDGLASFSNYGATTVTLGAPGVSILSTVRGGGYGTASGTSMATPQVSGALAVLWDQNPTWSMQQVIAKLSTSVDPIASLAGKTITGGRLNLSKLLATQSTGTASFVGVNTAAQGSWSKVGGADGYSISQGAASLPAYAQMAVTGNLNHTWAASTVDIRALQKADSADRLAATWYSSSSFAVDVSVTGGPRRVSAYFLDWDRNGRSQTVEVLDAATGALLDARTVSDFAGGKYLTWDLSGSVRIRVTRSGGVNAVLSGLFFGSPADNGSGTGAASFVGENTAAQGNWSKVSGADGYSISQGAASLPAYAQVSLSGNLNHTWAASTADARGLQKPGAADRLAATWYSSTSFAVDLTLTGGPRRVSAYFLDWDRNGRTQTVEVLDAATGALLDARTVSDFSGGTYLTWDLAGSVRLRVTNAGGTNAVLSGLFFD